MRKPHDWLRVWGATTESGVRMAEVIIPGGRVQGEPREEHVGLGALPTTLIALSTAAFFAALPLAYWVWAWAGLICCLLWLLFGTLSVVAWERGAGRTEEGDA